MTLNTIVHGPWIYLIIGVVWLAFSCMLFSIMAEIKPEERWLSRKLSMRLLLVAGGPLTCIVWLIGFFILMGLEWLEEKTYEIPKVFRDFFRESPT